MPIDKLKEIRSGISDLEEQDAVFRLRHLATEALEFGSTFNKDPQVAHELRGLQHTIKQEVLRFEIAEPKEQKSRELRSAKLNLDINLLMLIYYCSRLKS